MGEDKKHKVLDTALNTFMRYGYRRVTMGDLAEAAGMSRPALYLVFPGKEEIFRAVIGNFTEKAAQEIRAGIDERKTVQEKLMFTFEVWTVRPFELISNAPHATELTDCTHGFAQDLVEQGYGEFEKLLVSILAPGTDALARHELDVAQVAHVLATSARGFKESARHIDDLRALIGGLVGMALAALDT